MEDEEKENINEELNNNMQTLLNIVNLELNDQKEADDCVNYLCEMINDIVLPKCQTKNVRLEGQNRKREYTEDKPWFNDQCKQKYREYKNALNVFNREKSTENHNQLMMKKSVYKKLENTLKKTYKKQEGNMIQSLRKSNPKQFYRYFSKRKSKSPDSKITFDNFFEHFKHLSNEEGSIDRENISEIEIEHGVFDELDKIYP